MHLLTLFIVLSGLLGSTQVSSGLPLSSPDALQTRGLPVWDYYVDVDAAGHQAKFNYFVANGYRMVSLQAYGGSAATRYAAVWVQRSGPAYSAVHNVNAAQFQTWFDNNLNQGLVATIVTVTGPAGSEVYAGVMEQINVGAWFQSCGMTVDDFQAKISASFSNQQLLKSFDEFGTPGNRLYCGIWHTDPGVDKSTLYTALSASDYQTVFNSETTKPYWRPTILSVSDDITYAAAFTDTSVGTSWVARHGLTASALQAEVASEKKQGRYIIDLAAGGSGPSTRFAAVWAGQDIPSARTWRTAGSAPTGFNNAVTAAATAESLLKSFMQSSGVR